MQKQKCAAYCPNPTLYELKLYRKLKESGIRSSFEYLEEDGLLCLVIPEKDLTVMIQGDQWGSTENKIDPERQYDRINNSGGARIMIIDHSEIKKDPDLVAGSIREIIHK